jgi:hypothetical protein
VLKRVYVIILIVGIVLAVIAVSGVADALAKIVGDVVGSILITGIFSAKANVEMVPSTINIDLGRIGSSGDREYSNIAKLIVRNETSIIARAMVDTISKSGTIEIIGGAKLVLKGNNKTYVINMLCAISTSECIRPMVIIPGYDVPMKIEAGEYTIDLALSWQLRGSGETAVKIKIDIMETK